MGDYVLKDLENEGDFEDTMDKLTPNDSIFYSIGTSCIFSFVMLSIAGCFFAEKIFSRPLKKVGLRRIL